MYTRLSRLVLTVLGIGVCYLAVADDTEEHRAYLLERVLESEAQLTSYRYYYEASRIAAEHEFRTMGLGALVAAKPPTTHEGYIVRDGERRRSIHHAQARRGSSKRGVDILQFDGRAYRRISLEGASWDDVPRVTGGRGAPPLEELSSTEQDRIARELRQDTYSLDSWQTFYGTPVSAFLAEAPGQFPSGEMTSLVIAEETIGGDRCFRLSAEFTHPEVDSVGEIVINADRGYRPQFIMHAFHSRRIEWSLAWGAGPNGASCPAHAVYRRQHTPAGQHDKVVYIRVSDFETDVDFSSPERWRGDGPNWYDSAQQWLSMSPR